MLRRDRNNELEWQRVEANTPVCWSREPDIPLGLMASLAQCKNYRHYQTRHRCSTPVGLNHSCQQRSFNERSWNSTPFLTCTNARRCNYNAKIEQQVRSLSFGAPLAKFPQNSSVAFSLFLPTSEQANKPRKMNNLSPQKSHDSSATTGMANCGIPGTKIFLIPTPHFLGMVFLSIGKSGPIWYK